MSGSGKAWRRWLPGGGRGAWGLWAAVVAILALGMVLRLMDLTDEPLDFHPTAQLLRALTARGMYQHAIAEQQLDLPGGTIEVFEPPILERLVALTYQVIGAEEAWVVRIWNAVFWLIAGVVLFRLAWKATSLAGGLTSLAYFLILPFGVFVSRAFMPDSLMVLMIVVSGYFLIRWSETHGWGSAVLAGLASGAAILVKGRVAPMVLLTVLIVLLGGQGWRRLLREPQRWVIGGLSVIIPAIYYGVMITGTTAGWVGDFSLSLLWMTLSPSWYSRWLAWLDQIVYAGVMFLGLYGLSLLPATTRRMSLGWWVGFFITGLLLPYHIVTHNYYTLPLVPAIALGLAPVGQALLERLRGLALGWKTIAIGAALMTVFYPAWRARSVIVGQDFRGEPAGWRKVGEALPADGRIIAITQDYGYRLAYYSGRGVSLWPSIADQDFAELHGRNTSPYIADVFKEKAGGFRYFLVTNFSELDAQPELKEHLYSHFPVALEGDGYILFDLEAGE